MTNIVNVSEGIEGWGVLVTDSGRRFLTPLCMIDYANGSYVTCEVLKKLNCCVEGENYWTTRRNVDLAVTLESNSQTAWVFQEIPTVLGIKNGNAQPMTSIWPWKRKSWTV